MSSLQDNKEQAARPGSARNEARDPAMMNDARAELALQEGQFINALLGLAPSPEHLDSDQVTILGRTLKDKRARTINRFEKHCSEEKQFDCGNIEALKDYFRHYPGVHLEGPFADFRRYKRFLAVYRIKSFFTSFSRRKVE